VVTPETEADTDDAEGMAEGEIIADWDEENDAEGRLLEKDERVVEDVASHPTVTVETTVEVMMELTTTVGFPSTPIDVVVGPG